MVNKYYRYIFWTGYISVLVMTFLPVSFRTEKIKLGLDAFTIRTDHLLHFGVYFLIMMYYLFGKIKGLSIFRENSLNKYILLILALATVTETAQLWVPARAFNVLDWVANVVGIGVGAGVQAGNWQKDGSERLKRLKRLKWLKKLKKLKRVK